MLSDTLKLYKRRTRMERSWILNEFICKELFAPFVIDKDCEYLDSLAQKYNLVISQAQKAGADKESMRILHKYKNDILQSLSYYYHADIEKSNRIIRKLIKDLQACPFAVNELVNSDAFGGMKGTEIQLFRCRIGNFANAYNAKDMLHLPKSLRAKSGNYRFSIPGNPSIYMSNSSYGCWIEMGCPAENEFNVSPVLLDGTQRILNLAVSIRDIHALKRNEDRIHCWLKLLMLMIATSYRVKEEGRIFKSEYIVSQSIMMACKKLKYDGVAYYSKRVNDEIFAFCAINLALFVNYEGEYSDIIRHMKIDNAFNYGIYKQLCNSLTCKEYDLRSIKTGFITNIGNYERQYPYVETKFFEFDKFLFTSWRDKPRGKGKDQIPWGVTVE